MAKRQLHNCAEENSKSNPTARPYETTIWDRLSPESKRAVNAVRDRAGRKT